MHSLFVHKIWSQLDSSDNSHLLKTACWEACPRRSRLGERNTLTRRGKRFWTRRAAFSASKDTFPPRSTTSPHGRVCCAIIYAVSGGKQGLLNTLMDIWSKAPIVSTTLDRVDLDDPAAILRTVATKCPQYAGRVRRHYACAARHRAARQACGRVSDRRDREISSGARGDRPDDWRICTPCVTAWTSSRRLTSCGFISAIPASSLCANQNGWSYERAERWLGAQATWALLRNHPLC